MGKICVLNQETINQIAAGEVIERPASVVKELVENAIDAGATAVTVEIREGGISFVRVTDNGCGFLKEDLPLAFLRHSTSKIRGVEDLLHVGSLGFRGEALSSIAAVAQVELLTCAAGQAVGSRYRIEGGREIALEEVGAPEGTTFLVRNLFFNTPVRRKFLKTPATEGSYIGELMERLALSRPDLSLRLLVNGQVKLQTAGSHNLKDIIYSTLGRDITANLIPVEAGNGILSIRGFIGKPQIARGNRSYEIYFINGRYIKSRILQKAVEDGYKSFLMQHKYPLVVLHLTIAPEFLDVNVHPTKMELRFRGEQQIYEFLAGTVRSALLGKELIPHVALDAGQGEKGERAAGKESPSASVPARSLGPEPFEKKRREAAGAAAASSGFTARAEGEHRLRAASAPFSPAVPESMAAVSAHTQPAVSESTSVISAHTGPAVPEPTLATAPDHTMSGLSKPALPGMSAPMSEAVSGYMPQAQETPSMSLPSKQTASLPVSAVSSAGLLRETTVYEKKQPQDEPVQQTLFEEKLLSPQKRADFRLIGQLFDTYWLLQAGKEFLIIDQHAAHEKVLYERTMKRLEKEQIPAQQLAPPMILTLSLLEIEVVENNQALFERMGFSMACFGGREYAVYSVPDHLYGIADQELLLAMIDELAQDGGKAGINLLVERVASASCKAAVKGNHRLSFAEAEQLLSELLTLENPYTCPHGRPTIISMSRYELEKKFKRIL